MTGYINARSEAVLPLRFVGPAGHADIVAVIDTGFTATLTLPEAVVARLGLEAVSEGSATLADGSAVDYHIYAAEVVWDGAMKPVFVYAIGTDTLAGIGLLKGHRLQIDLTPGGGVEVTPH